ncbi:Tungstate-binding protein TupA [Fulvia fulva]|uniref:Tungstate-binding protein TupA n=1 Tax=Passalora fulva TaxID=5499 RepID=A0A9Q8P518_PASFU|nr:Tungstate-binding protein TupA [Fulvia fulva]UJO13307.1 Tungstate-binding protein TupA [Fulvia fulva]WPV11776.1 Tungstate-binding protein TupA [Fulvia fulva]
MADGLREADHVDANSLPQCIAVTHPHVARYRKTRLLEQDHGPAGSQSLSTIDQEVYGDPRHPIRFRIGNGGAGFTGLLRVLSESYIREHGNDFGIGWVANHSRYSQLALLADVVQVALTYEPDNEDLAIGEGWAVRVCRAFNDHFVLAGPESDLGARTIVEGLRSIAQRNLVADSGPQRLQQLIFHTRGDGSATYCKERSLWKAAGTDIENSKWVKTYAVAPYDALRRAEAEGAFLISDRATFLSAKEDGVISSLRVHVEGGPELLNPCSALVRDDATRMACQEGANACDFAKWLSGSKAQDIIHDYGRDWKLEKPLFTVATQKEFAEDDRLVPSR